jgi:hypothetical protein
MLAEAFQGGRGVSVVPACRSKLRMARAARRSPPAPRKKEWRWGRWLGLGAKGQGLGENTRTRDEK